MSCVPWPEGTDDVSETAANLKAGDIVNFQGQGVDAQIIMLGQWGARGTHTSVCIGNINGRPHLTEAYPTIIQVYNPVTGKAEDAIDPFTGTAHTGIQTVDAEYRLLAYPTHRCLVRKLCTSDGSAIRHDDIAKRMCAYLKDMSRRTHGQMEQYYLKNLPICFVCKGWWEFGTHSDDDDNMYDGKRYWVCTAHVMKMFQEGGICATQYRGQPVRPGKMRLDDVCYSWRQPEHLLGAYRFSEVIVLERPEPKREASAAVRVLTKPYVMI